MFWFISEVIAIKLILVVVISVVNTNLDVNQNKIFVDHMTFAVEEVSLYKQWLAAN